MQYLFPGVIANRISAAVRCCLILLAAFSLSSAHGATTASIARGNTIYSNVCAACHGPNAADNNNRIGLGANNPTRIQAAITSNTGSMGFLSSQLSSTDITDVADYLGSIFQPSLGTPAIGASPASIEFASRAVGTSGGGTILTVSNTGAGTLNISGITVSSTDFTIASGCAASLAPGTNCFVTVTFSPKSGGALTGIVTIQTNATPATTQIAISGIGIAPYTGLWWNPNESGWGMSVTQQGTTIFVAMYTYDQSGLPAWYVMSSCPVIGKGCSGDIYRVTGGTSLGTAWNGAGKIVTKAGTGTLSFTDNDNGAFTYVLNGANGTKAITRQLFATGPTQPATDYSALWWNPDESGWGVAITRQFDMIFVALYTYDNDGTPVWYVASSCPVVGSGCTGDLLRVAGGSTPTMTWNGSSLVVTKIGTVSFVFTDASSGKMDYTINGVSSSRSIIRQSF